MYVYHGDIIGDVVSSSDSWCGGRIQANRCCHRQVGSHTDSDSGSDII